MAFGGVLTKLLYSFVLLNLKYTTRYILGIVLCITSVIILYLGVVSLSLFAVVLSAFLIGIGTLVLYLTFMTYLKHYPTEYLSSYLIGDYGGGILITLIYFLIEYLKFPFQFVLFSKIP